MTRGYALHSPSQRASSAALVIVLHAVGITLVMLSRSPAPKAEKTGLVAFDVTDDIAKALAPRHTPRVVAAAMASPAPSAIDKSVTAQMLPAVTPVADAQPPQRAISGGGDCDLSQPVQDALIGSDEVRQQLPTIPVNDRSVANAVTVWNAGWTDPGTATAQPALAAIRRAITQFVGSSSAACRNAAQFGPRLLYLPGAAGKTIVLALGSGRWTWQQLIDAVPLAPAGSTMAVAPPPSVLFAPARPATALPGQNRGMDSLLASLIHKRSPEDLPYYP